MDNQRYNVLFIQTDQWSQNFMGYRGCSEIMTPTIDQLKRRGDLYKLLQHLSGMYTGQTESDDRYEPQKPW